jgi:hypothetical protein
VALEQWQKDFIEQLGLAGNDPPWELRVAKSPSDVSYYLLRRGPLEGPDCPLSDTVRRKLSKYIATGDFDTMEEVMGYTSDQRRRITTAADDRRQHPMFNSEFRAAMLAAVGLQEVQ